MRSFLWTGGTTGEFEGGRAFARRALFSECGRKVKAAVPQSVDELRLTLLSISHGYARTSDSGDLAVVGRSVGDCSRTRGLARLCVASLPTLL